jgi:hypothetical protein
MERITESLGSREEEGDRSDGGRSRPVPSRLPRIPFAMYLYSLGRWLLSSPGPIGASQGAAHGEDAS